MKFVLILEVHVVVMQELSCFLPLCCNLNMN